MISSEGIEILNIEQVMTLVPCLLVPCYVKEDTALFLHWHKEDSA